MNSINTKYFLILFFMLVWCTASNAQNVIIQQSLPQNFSVCNTTQFSITILNNEPSALTSATVSVAFPAGASYLPGTIAGSGVSEFNISNLEKPIFNLGNVPAGASRQFTIGARAGCGLVQKIDAGEKFSNKIEVQWAGGSKDFTSANYIIETPLLFVTATTGMNLFGAMGEMRTRSVTIRNNRNGPLSEFTFSDSHPAGGFVVSTDVGTVLENTAISFKIRLTAADFQKIGDGDGIFEENESITIIQKLTITACGINPEKSPSDFEFFWGCGSDTCQILKLNAQVNFFKADAEPEISFVPQYSMAEDFCGNPTNEQFLTIRNSGKGTARNTRIHLFNFSKHIFPSKIYAGVDALSVYFDSAGVKIFPQILNVKPTQLIDCQTISLFDTAVVVLPFLAAGDSVQLRFRFRACDEFCTRQPVKWGFRSIVFPNCPTDAPGKLSDSIFVLPQAPHFYYGEDTLCHKKALQNGETFNLKYFFQSDILHDSVGTFRATFRMPCGVSWGGNSLILNGLSPVKSGVQPLAVGSEIWFEYPLPISKNTLEGTANFKFDCSANCLASGCTFGFDATMCPNACDFDPDTLPSVVLQSVAEIFLDPKVLPGCGIRTCQNFTLHYDCDKTCPVQPVGFVRQNLDFRRVNFGQADFDDDRRPDAGFPDLSKIRLDRFLPGDTAQTILRTVVDANMSDASFENALLRIYFESSSEDAGWDGGTSGQYNAPDDILEIQRVLHIFDASSGQVFTCNLPQPELTNYISEEIKSLNISHDACADELISKEISFFTHDVSPQKLVAAGCALPPNFKYSVGDSMILRTRHVFMRNPTDPDRPVILNMRVRTFATIFNGYEPSNLALNNNAPPQDFSCECQFRRFQIGSVWVNLSRLKMYAPTCQLAELPLNQKLEMKIGMDNFFPFEFRPLGKMLSWQHAPAFPVTLKDNFIEKLTYENPSKIILQNTAVPFSQQGDVFLMNVATFSGIDEGFSCQLLQRFDVPCSLTDWRQHISTVQFQWEKPLPFLPSPTSFSRLSGIEFFPRDTFGFIPLRPFLFASSNQLVVNTSTQIANWEVNFISSGKEIAPNIFAHFQNASGQLVDFQMFELPSGTPVQQVNGIFQLGNLPSGEVKKYRITARNLGCTDENLTMFYGWNCSPLAELSEVVCSRKTLTFMMNVDDTKLELDIDNPPSATTQLCAEQAWHGASVANVLDGPAFDVQLEMALPTGLRIVPGSCQMSYPDGAAWKNIPDPTALGSFGRGWRLADLVPSLAATGLPGFQKAPANSARFRFKTSTECGFISGTYIFYKTTARENCGGAANTIIRPGKAIRLDGAPDPDAVSIAVSVGSPQPVACGDTLAINFSFVGNTTSGNRDSIFVLLPPGVRWVQNGYVAGQNAPSAMPSVKNWGNRQQLAWQQRAGVPAGQSVVMSLRLTDFGSQACGVLDTILLRTTTQQFSTCVATGSPCDAQAITGETFITIQSAKTEFELLDFDINFDAGIPVFNVKLKNKSNFLHLTPTILNFWNDRDGSGTITPGDEKRHTHPVFFPIGPVDVIELVAGIPLDLSELCHLLVALDADEMCTCQSVLLPIDSISRKISPKTVCSGDFIGLGVLPTVGHQYQWTPSLHLPCDTCAAPQFFFENKETMPMTFAYIFKETAGDCMVASDVQVTVLPMPQILTPDTSICVGQSVRLVTTPAVQYQWFGNGIANPSAANPVVSPLATSIYFVKLTDEQGCSAIDTIKIMVQEAGLALIGPDTLAVCGNQTLQFEAFFNPKFEYQWSPAGVVSNPMLHNPIFIGTTSQTLVLTVTIPNSTCVSRDTVFVGFSDNPTIAASTLALSSCFGDTAVVTLSGAQDYFWAPSAGVFCQNSSCSIVGLDPAASTTYLIVGYNNFGCKDSLEIRVEVPGTVIKTYENSTTCSGEPVSIFGQLTDRAGIYFKKILQPNGCDSIHFITLAVLDTFLKEEKRPLCPGGSIQFGGQTIRQPGKYCLTFASQQGCDSTQCLVVENAALPTFDSLIRVTAAEGTVWQVNGVGAGFQQIQWSPVEFLSCSDCPNPNISLPLDRDSLEFLVKMSTAAGCEVELRYRVRILPPCSAANVRFPTAFTPNGDGKNDVFRVVPHEGFETFGTLKIYNRWGQRIFTTDDPIRQGWDGRTPSGTDLPSDTYIYVLEVLCSGGNYSRSGEISLLR